MIKPDVDSLKRKLPEFQILEEIGSGGFKVVYKAIISGNKQALKLGNSLAE